MKNVFFYILFWQRFERERAREGIRKHVIRNVLLEMQLRLSHETASSSGAVFMS